MEKSKTSKVLMIVMLLVILGLSFYIVYDKGFFVSNNSNTVKQKSLNKENENVLSNTDTTKDNDCKVERGIDSNKCINNNNKYTLAVYNNGGRGIDLTLDDSRKKLTISFNCSTINRVYSLGWVTALESYDMEKQDIAFDQEIADMFIGGFGQDSSNDTLLLLMKDGSIQYIPIRKAFQNDRMSLKSYGKLSDVSDVIKFYSANVTDGVTTIAQKADGTFYDLSVVLKNTGNY